MDSGLLSQHQIDDLLGTARPSTVASPSGTPATVRPYDFRRPHRVSTERLRTLEAMYDRMVTSLESWVIGRIRGQIEMRLQTVEQSSFGEFMLTLPTPCASYIVGVNDSGGQQGVINVGHEFAMYLVDRLFGGTGQRTALDRPLTRVERTVVQTLIDRILLLLQEVWADHIPLAFQVDTFESLPDMVLQSANRDDPVLVTTLEVSMGEMQSLIMICLPFAVLDNFFTSPGKRRVNEGGGSEQERAESRKLTEQLLRGTHVPVSARFPAFRMAMRDLVALTEGRIITTPLSPDAPLSVAVGSQERFVGTPGRVGQHFAVCVQDAMGNARMPHATLPDAPTDAGEPFLPSVVSPNGH